jgi:putative phosphoesterase
MDGKKILVLSDTHGSVSALRAVLSWAKDRVPPNGAIGAAVFLGDGVSDLGKAADASGFFCEWKLVCGNNDYGYSLPDAAVFEFADHRFYMCHGHHHSLYGGHHTLVSAAGNSQADVVLFGHTHVPCHKTVNGITLVNPGSVGRPRSRIGATFALIECPEGEQINPEFWGIGERGGIQKVKI